MHENLALLQISGTKYGDDQYSAEQYCPKPVDPSLTATLLVRASHHQAFEPQLLRYLVFIFFSSY